MKKQLKSRKLLANNIKYYRLKRGLSQEEHAEFLGTTPVYLSSLENAKRNIRLDYIEHIANTLEVNIKDLFIEREIVEKKKRPRRKKIK
ncbi:MAG TPA: helix-turn-helix transcriptional regulator [Candidatus Onthocola stercoravium]|nr:helix-turn-helix transcriptional regulator [Candidatus Onthocola stercoravium]